MKSTTYATRTYTQADPINGWMRALGLGVMLAFVARGSQLSMSLTTLIFSAPWARPSRPTSTRHGTG